MSNTKTKRKIPILKEYRLHLIKKSLECIDKNRFNRYKQIQCILNFYPNAKSKSFGHNEKSIFRGMVIPTLRHLGLIIGSGDSIRLSGNGKLIIESQLFGEEIHQRALRSVIYEIDENKFQLLDVIKDNSPILYNEFISMMYDVILAPSKRQKRERIKKWLAILQQVGLIYRTQEKIMLNVENYLRTKFDRDLKNKNLNSFKKCLFASYIDLRKKETSVVSITDLREKTILMMLLKYKEIITEGLFDALLRRIPFETNEYKISLGKAMRPREKTFEFKGNYYSTVIINFKKRSDTKMHEFMRKYYGLKKDPFEDWIAIEEHVKMWVDREEHLKKWKEILEKAVTQHRNFIKFIVGSYGRGKTLSLFKIIDEAKKYPQIFSAYLNFKGEERSKPGLDFIFKIFKSIDFKKILDDKTGNEIKAAIENIPESFEEPKTILKKIYLKLFNEQSKNQEKLSKLALYFLRGEIKPSKSELRELEVLRKIDMIDIAKHYLAAILCFLKNLGYNTLLLAVDEFEYLFSLVPKTQHAIYIALLRGLYDFPIGLTPSISREKIANMVIFIAVSEDGWESLRNLAEREASIGGPTVPLMERVGEHFVLDTFNKEQTRELIEKRLSYNRIKGKFEDQPLIPFTEDFVDFIYEITKGEPREVIVRCDHVLDAGLAERVKLLDRKFAERVLRERGF